MTEPSGELLTPDADARLSPFIEFRRHLDVYQEALDVGMADDSYVELVAELDDDVRRVAGVGFRTTPLVELETPLGRPVLAKVETGNVAGSHKARHLFGLLLKAQLTPHPASAKQPRLAIASCGNAALGAAVVAAAGHRELDIFVPVDADPRVLERLHHYGAHVITCPRKPGVDGDPCMHGLEVALAAGATAFTVQGTICPAAFDGARTLGLELAQQLAAADRAAGDGLENTDLYIQVGGGAFATAVMDGLRRSNLPTQPRLHPVQPATAHPYAAAWERLVPRFFEASGLVDPIEPHARARALRSPAERGELDPVLAAGGDAMTPWPTTPHSIATGILDDVTYDWLPLMRHQLLSGGRPILVSEDQLRIASDCAATQVTPPPDATGAAGLAGVFADHDQLTDHDQRTEPEADLQSRVTVVILSGIDRVWEETNRLSAPGP